MKKSTPEDEKHNKARLKMKMTLLAGLLLIPAFLFGQKPETQISFAQESAQAQTYKIERVDSYLKLLESNSKFMGYVLISHAGSVLYQNGFGYADVENRIPFSDTTIICICSTGKIFTATIIMKLVQENKIQLDDKIGKYFPELPYGDNILIKHLLTHTSGLGQYQDNPLWHLNKNCAENIEFIKTQKLKFTPGEKTYYSTSGMILLGALIEKIYHKNFIDIVESDLIIPYGMNNTSFLSYKEAFEKNKGNMPHMYKIDDNGQVIIRGLTKTDNVLTPLAAGGQLSCASDLLKFDQALYSYKILNKESLDQMIEKQYESEWTGTYFGLGCVVEDAGSPIEGAGHGGGDNVYYNHFKRQDVTLIITAIEGYSNPKYSKDVFEIAEDVKKMLFEDINLFE